MTQPTDVPPLYDSHGRPASGLPPIVCPSWCDDPGHVSESMQDDQNCFAPVQSVNCTLEPVEISKAYAAAICYSVVDAFAYRGFNRMPVVRLYLCGFEPYVDFSIELKAHEATAIANRLVLAAGQLAETGYEVSE